jgi:serine protease AprX
MSIIIPRKLVEFVLLGPTHDRRQLQDSPILGDVWLEFAARPDKPIELLIAPDKEQPAGLVADRIDELVSRGDEEHGADVAPLHGIVAARLKFRELLSIVVPMTGWWQSTRVKDQLRVYTGGADGPLVRSELPSDMEVEGAERLDRLAAAILVLAQKWTPEYDERLAEELLPALDRFLALAGLILVAGVNRPEPAADGAANVPLTLAQALAGVKAQDIVALIVDLLDEIQKRGDIPKLVWQISLNRTATPALERSVPAVKADAARRLFGVDCGEIAWAVIDSGIQGDHPAFRDAAGDMRVKQAFDFSGIRKIVSLDNRKDNAARKERLKELLHGGLVKPPSEAEAIALLEELANDARSQRPINWELVRPFVEIRRETPPISDHGTHVAGIIGASRESAEAAGDGSGDAVDGMCPDMKLYDFRVLAPGIRETEFAIIAALQYIRYLNARTDYTTIHGANLSLSIPHDVRNYACGRTPICMECERTVESGVVVVAAAGNFGFQSYQTATGRTRGTPRSASPTRGTPTA